MPTDPGSLDAAFEVLADPERRRVLYYLREHDRAPVAELADVVAGWLAASRSGRAGTPREHETVEIALRHSHLPKLVDAGFVEYDRERDVVEYGPPPAPVESHLDLALAVEFSPEDDDIASVAEGTDDRWG